VTQWLLPLTSDKKSLAITWISSLMPTSSFKVSMMINANNLTYILMKLKIGKTYLIWFRSYLPFCACYFHEIFYFKLFLVSKWLLFNSQSAVFQHYHCENNLHFDEMKIMSSYILEKHESIRFEEIQIFFLAVCTSQNM
jgi:hypothetical protein